MELVKFCDPK